MIIKKPENMSLFENKEHTGMYKEQKKTMMSKTNFDNMLNMDLNNNTVVNSLIVTDIFEYVVVVLVDDNYRLYAKT